MPSFELVEKLRRRPDLSFFRVLQALTDAFRCIGAGGNVEQALIGFDLLHDGRLPIYRKQDRPPAFFQLLHKVADRRREVVSDWMSFVMSSMACSY